MYPVTKEKTMHGIPYNCILCTFKSYTFGVLWSHSKVFHRGLKVQRAGRSFTPKPCNYPKNRMRGITQDQPYQSTTHHNLDCSYCKHKSTSRRNLQQHIISCHTNIRHFKCQLCRKSFSSKYRLQNHTKTHFIAKKFKCQFCSYTATQIGRVNAHLKEVHAELKRFQCKSCRARFKRSDHLQSHILRVHSTKTFTCKLCSKTYSSKRTLMTHTTVHTATAVPAKCKMCSQTYSSQEVLKRHVKTMHGNGKGFKCKICGLKLAAIHSLFSHMKRNHCSKKSIFECTMCTKVYTRIVALRYHVKMVHINNENPERTYQCSLCSASFFTKARLTNHYRVHDVKRLRCGLCSAVFKDRSALQAHLFTHNRTKRYQCPFCPLKWRFLSDLKCHLKSHENNKNVKCLHESCEKSFTTKSLMLIHWRDIHLKARRQKCGICGLICNNPGSLHVSFFSAIQNINDTTMA